MADIELVIKIPEEAYEYWKEHKYEYVLAEAIANGIPLPKRHGKLIDADKQILEIEEIYNGYMLSESGVVSPNDFVEFLEEAPTIIEADKGEK